MPPLSLDSKRWARLTHAYGSAADTPDLLRRLYESPDRDVWSDLCGGSVVHQGDVSEAAYAALPHVLAAAESVPASDRLRYVSFAASVIDGPKRKPCPDDLNTEYENVFDTVREMAIGVLKAGGVEDWELPYVFEAIAAPSGLPVLARILMSFSTKEFDFPCASCESWLRVSTRKTPFEVRPEGSHRDPDSPSTPITPPERPRSDSHTPTSGDEALPWLLWLSELQENRQFQDKLVSLYGDGECPRCHRSVHLYSEVEQEEKEPHTGIRFP